MKRIILPMIVVAAAACKGGAGYNKAEDAQEAAQEFVRASLDGNYDKAFFYLYKDSSGVNEMLFNKWKGDYNKWSQEEKVGHKESNIIVITTDKINDSTLNYVFRNSYKKDTTTIKVIKTKGEWLIDLKDIH